jgi:hypothetical protein
VSKSAPPTTTPKPSSAFLLKRMQAEEESVGLSMEEVVRLSQNRVLSENDNEDNGPQLSSLNSMPEQQQKHNKNNSKSY